MNNIPEEYKINQTINHKEYLINGEIRIWEGKQANVISTLLCDSEDKEPLLLGKTPEMNADLALEALSSASNAFKQGQGQWPTMKVYE